MTIDVEYFYVPLFGVEKYLPPNGGIEGNGGAEETNDNLLATLWTWDNEADAAGELLVPIADADTSGGEPIPDNLRNLLRANMKSRVATQFVFEGAPKFDGLLAILNPPQEYKQQIAGAVERIGDIAVDEEEAVNFTRPTASLNSWWVKCAFRDTVEEFEMETPEFIEAEMSGFFEFPFFKTNGADGNPPETFWDLSGPPTNADYDRMIAAFNSGDFYVGMLLFPTDNCISIEWPYSTSRG
jgi:hypothetical protein